MKLGLQGVTFLVASGDDGVAGRATFCCENPGCKPSADGSILSVTINETTGFPGTLGKTFVPGFPSTCPYVTSVGATMITPGSSVHDPEVAVAEPGLAPYYSGGGFSNLFAIPDYQRRAQEYYFDKHRPPYTAGQ